MKKFTADCINSNVAIILEVEYEIIQVDNASTVGCQVQFSSDERILFLEAEESFGKENNLGVLHAKDSISFSNVNNPIFRYEYKLFNGYLYSNVGKVCLWSLYHHCLKHALYVANHDSKLHGSSHKISCAE